MNSSDDGGGNPTIAALRLLAGIAIAATVVACAPIKDNDIPAEEAGGEGGGESGSSSEAAGGDQDNGVSTGAQGGNSSSAGGNVEMPPTCGDGQVDADEECDDGDNDSEDGCSASCRNEFCGDGVLQVGLDEACDDGNGSNEDGCSVDCAEELCGDGIVQPRLGEECDDGNTIDSDACNDHCESALDMCDDSGSVLLNPGFDDGTQSPWSSDGTPLVVPMGQFGEYAVETSGSNYVEQVLATPVEVVALKSASFWAWQGAGSAAIVVEWEYLDGTGGSLEEAGVPGTWRKIELWSHLLLTKRLTRIRVMSDDASAVSLDSFQFCVDCTDFPNGGQGCSVGDGSANACSTASDCPGADTDCRTRVCELGQCGWEDAELATTCDDNGGQICDGEGLCVDVGQACLDDNDCATGACTDGVCCTSSCDGGCERCNVPGSEGVCQPYAASSDPENSCGAGTCDGSGQCSMLEPLMTESWGDFAKQQAETIVSDSNGDVVISGVFDGTLDMGAGAVTAVGAEDMFVARLDGTGGGIWIVRFGKTGKTIPTASTIDSAGNVFVAGTFDGAVDFGSGIKVSSGQRDIFLVKINSAGTVVWSKTFGDTADQEPAGVAVDSNGDVVMVGNFAGTLFFGGGSLHSAGQDDVFLVTFSGNGTWTCDARFGDGGAQSVSDVAMGPFDEYLLAGNFNGAINFGGGWLSSPADHDAYVAKFGAGCSFVNHAKFGGLGGDQFARAVALAADGTAWLAGMFDGEMNLGVAHLSSHDADGFLIKLDGNENPVDAMEFGNDYKEQEPLSLGVDGAGNVVMVGRFQGQMDLGGSLLLSLGNYDMFVAKFSADLTHLHSAGYGGPDTQSANDLAVNANGTFVLTGVLRLQLKVGATTLTTSGGEDVFALKFSP